MDTRAHPPSSTFEVSGVEFKPFGLALGGESTGSSFWLGKEPTLVSDWLELLARFSGGNILELGTFHGASSALCALVAEPSLLVVVDIAPNVPPALAEFLTGGGPDTPTGSTPTWVSIKAIGASSRRSPPTSSARKAGSILWSTMPAMISS